MHSPLFNSGGDTIYLAEDAPAVAVSINSSSSTSSGSSIGVPTKNSPTSQTNNTSTKSRVSSSKSKDKDLDDLVKRKEMCKDKDIAKVIEKDHSKAPNGKSKATVGKALTEDLSGGEKLRFEECTLSSDKLGNTYGEELDANSPSGSPSSPRMLSPVDSPRVSEKTRSTQLKPTNKKVPTALTTVEKVPPPSAQTTKQKQKMKKMQKSVSSTHKAGHSLKFNTDILDAPSAANRNSQETPTRLQSEEGDILGNFFHQVGDGQEEIFSPPYNSSSSTSDRGSQPSSTTNQSKSIAKASNESRESFPVRSARMSASVVSVNVSVQTEGPLVTEKWVMTDPLPPVENFKEGYEKVSREKKDLQVKLERIEDQRFKMQRDHKRELEKLKKKYFNEAREVSRAVLLVNFYTMCAICSLPLRKRLVGSKN